MKTIKLYGDLAEKFKPQWTMDVNTPAEAARAIEANRPGFIQEADQGNYILIMVSEQDEDGYQVAMDNGLDIWPDHYQLYIVPRIDGEGIGAAIVGAIGASALSFTTAAGAVALTTLGSVVAAVINIAIAVAVSAIASLITGGGGDYSDVSSSNYEAPENKPSYLFNGPVNTTRQGHRIPLLYGGPMLVGSMVLSSGINVKDI